MARCTRGQSRPSSGGNTQTLRSRSGRSCKVKPVPIFNFKISKRKRHSPDVQGHGVMSRALLDDLGPDRCAAPALATRAEPEGRRDDLLCRHLPFPRDDVPRPESVARRGAAPHDRGGGRRGRVFLLFLGGRRRTPRGRCREREMPREDGDEKEERRPKAMMHIICSGLLPDATTLQRRQNNDDNNEKKYPETKKKERNVGTA